MSDMRTWILAIILVVALTVGALAPVAASAAGAPSSAPAGEMARATNGSAASFAGTRVKVQLVTLGAVLVLVVGVGSTAYFVRRKLGLDVRASGDEPPSAQH
jgi:hypothetical protein